MNRFIVGVREFLHKEAAGTCLILAAGLLSPALGLMPERYSPEYWGWLVGVVLLSRIPRIFIDRLDSIQWHLEVVRAKQDLQDLARRKPNP